MHLQNHLPQACIALSCGRARWACLSSQGILDIVPLLCQVLHFLLLFPCLLTDELIVVCLFHLLLLGSFSQLHHCCNETSSFALLTLLSFFSIRSFACWPGGSAHSVLRLQDRSTIIDYAAAEAESRQCAALRSERTYSSCSASTNMETTSLNTSANLEANRDCLASANMANGIIPPWEHRQLRQVPLQSHIHSQHSPKHMAPSFRTAGYEHFRAYETTTGSYVTRKNRQSPDRYLNSAHSGNGSARSQPSSPNSDTSSCGSAATPTTYCPSLASTRHPKSVTAFPGTIFTREPPITETSAPVPTNNECTEPSETESATLGKKFKTALKKAFVPTPVDKSTLQWPDDKQHWSD